MSLSAKLRRAPLRVATGAFVLNSGVTKLSADEHTAKWLHGMATGTYPFLGKLEPTVFAKVLAGGEIALGSALLLPFVSPVVAGAGLAAFSGGLLNMYWQTEGMHEPGDPRPTQQGTAIAKDVWMFGIGTGLVVDGILAPAHDKKLELTTSVHEKRDRKAKQGRKARKAAKRARAQARAHAIEVAREKQAELSKRAAKAVKKAQKKAEKSDAVKRARKTSGRAAKRLADVRDEYGPVAVEKAKHAREAAVDASHRIASAASDAVDDYGPVVVEKAKQAREAARSAAEEYGPVAAEKAKQARDAAQDAAKQARQRAQHAMR